MTRKRTIPELVDKKENLPTRRILNVTTGEVFDTPTQAARAIDQYSHGAGVNNVLRRTNRTRSYKGNVYVYTDD